MTSDYKEGDVISLTFGVRDRSGIGNVQIIRVLPVSETGQRQYRVSGADGRERAIVKHQIRAGVTQRNHFGNPK